MERTSSKPIKVELFQARDAEQAYSIRIAGEEGKPRRAERGFGSDFQKVWAVDFEGGPEGSLDKIDWEAVLERVIEAYEMSDPVITDFLWPALKEE